MRDSLKVKRMDLGIDTNDNEFSIADFRRKTEELFHQIGGLTPADIERTVREFVESKIEGHSLDAAIVDVVLSGSRCRGLEHSGSDIDVVVEFESELSEHHLFNTLHEDKQLYIAGIPVDINPITRQQTGTMSEYLAGANEFLENKIKKHKSLLGTKSIFRMLLYDVDVYYENISGMTAEELLDAYNRCEKPFVEMCQYGRQIGVEEFAYIQQSKYLDFYVVFNADIGEASVFDGKGFTDYKIAKLS